MNICVFCSASDLDEKYTTPAKELAKRIAESGHNLVWGGSDCGLMKLMADGVQQGGGKIIGISVEWFKDSARKNANKMIIAKDLGERKAALLEHADAVVMMVGGLGTLDEATEMIELKKQGHHDKVIIILNTDGYYDGLQQQLRRMAEEPFLRTKESNGRVVPPLTELVRFVKTPEEVMNIIGQHHDGAGVMEIPRN